MCILLYCQPGSQQQTRRTAIDSYLLSAGLTAANPPYSNRFISCQSGSQQQTRRTAIDSYLLSAGLTAANPPYRNRFISPVSRAHIGQELGVLFFDSQMSEIQRLIKADNLIQGDVVDAEHSMSAVCQRGVVDGIER